jgi:PASTA domain
VTAGDAGGPIACRGTATNIVGAATATSIGIAISPAGTDVGGVPAPRVRAVRRVAISGASVVGMRLRCERSGITGATRLTIAWKRNGKATGRIGATYRIGRKDLAAARTRAGFAGCRTRVQRVAAVGVPRGSVISTTPTARAKRPNGATVTLIVRR